MKKNNRVLRIGLLALVLTLVTASLVSGTFAKYVTTVNGTGTVQVAKWKVQVGTNSLAGTEGNAESTLFDLAKTFSSDTGVADNRVAPGRTGKFNLKYDTTGSEVSHQITIKLTKSTADFPAQIKFYTDEAKTAAHEIKFVGNDATLTPINVTGTAGTTGSVDIFWGWDFVVGSTGTDDEADTAEGKKSASYTMTASFTATQTDGAVYNP